MKKRVVIIITSLLLILVSIVFFGYHQMLAKALENSFYRTPQIVWIDETNLASGKTIEIPFSIFLGPDEEENYSRRLKVGRTKSVRLKFGHYKLAPWFSYEVPSGWDITIEPTDNWFKREDNTLTITVHSTAM